MTSVATHPPLGALVWTRSRTRVPPVVTMALRESPKRVFESMDADGTDPALIEHLHWMHVGDCAPRTIYERRRLITRLGRAMDKPILQATTEDINAFLLTAASPGTRNAYYNTCPPVLPVGVQKRADHAGPDRPDPPAPDPATCTSAAGHERHRQGDDDGRHPCRDDDDARRVRGAAVL